MANLDGGQGTDRRGTAVERTVPAALHTAKPPYVCPQQSGEAAKDSRTPVGQGWGFVGAREAREALWVGAHSLGDVSLQEQTGRRVTWTGDRDARLSGREALERALASGDASPCHVARARETARAKRKRRKRERKLVESWVSQRGSCEPCSCPGWGLDGSEGRARNKGHIFGD